MGLGFCFVLAAPVLAPILTLTHATDCGTGGSHFASAVLPVLLLGIVTGPVIQRFMLVAAHLRAHCTGSRAAYLKTIKESLYPPWINARHDTRCAADQGDHR
ncbi:hypothetical protein STW0522PSE72_25650 [Pseudomonas monteilii]|nr:hypothetical protein STW0522PSE72_25650 [Pseudomonas monteilii]